MKRQTELLKILGLTLVVALLLVAYGASQNVEPAAGSAPEATETAGSDEGQVTGYDSLLEALRAAGLSVAPGESLEDPLFDVEARSIVVDGVMVQVFEFADEASAQEAADTVNDSGTIVGTTTIDWIEVPHFYQQGRLIVLYAGSEEMILEGLQEVLGEPFVVGQTIGLPPAMGEEAENAPDTASFIEALRTAGATVEVQEMISQPFFGPEAQIIKVNGEDVQVFEFANEDAASEAAALVSEDGTEVGTSMVTWMSTPHFYQQGKIIVIYVGEKSETLDLLQDVLGAQFAGG